jgi:hypothetical protein
MSASRGRARLWLIANAVLALVILVPAMYGFGTKFLEFLALAGDPEGSFTVLPILNYLLAGLGFLALFVWATWHGMFRDIERPKHALLENERKLDAAGEEERHEPQ